MLFGSFIFLLVTSLVININSPDALKVRLANPLNARQVAQQPDTTVYTIVQVQPEFPGGTVEMFRFIQFTSKYPVSIVRSKASQSVSIKLLIEKDGVVSKVTLPFAKEKGDLEKEAERIGREMPKWKPGYHNGGLIRVYVIVPIYFQPNKIP